MQLQLKRSVYWVTKAHDPRMLLGAVASLLLVLPACGTEMAELEEDNAAAIGSAEQAVTSCQPRYFWLRNGSSNKCLNTYGQAFVHGQPFQSTCDDNEYQHFEVVQLTAREFALRNRKTGLCLDIPDASTANNVKVQLYGCHFGANQRFTDGNYPYIYHGSLIFKHSTKCMDIPWGSAQDGLNPQQFTCHGGPAQIWDKAVPPSQFPCWI